MLSIASSSSNVLLNVKPMVLDRFSTTFPEASNTLFRMGKKLQSAAAILAANLRTLMQSNMGRSSSPQAAKKSGMAQRTINNVEKARHDTKLSTIEAIAKGFNLEAYQLLCPDAGKDFFLLCQAWNVANSQETELLLTLAQSIKRRDDEQQRPPSPPGPLNPR